MIRVICIHSGVCIALAVALPPWASIPAIIAATGIAIRALRDA